MTRLMSAILLIALAIRTASSAPSPTATDAAPTAAPTLIGCFSSHQPLVKADTYQYQSSGHCWGVCSDKNQAVLGLANGISCWCGDELPSADTKVAESHCSTPCEGYDLEDCGGGTKYFTVWLTGTESNVAHYNGSSGSKSPSPVGTGSPTSSTSSRSGSSTTTANNAPSASGTANETTQHTGSSNKSGTILGVVLGLTAFTALVMVALIFWCLWRRRRRRGRFFLSGKTASLSNVPLRPDDEADSITSNSTYSSHGPSEWEDQDVLATVPRDVPPMTLVSHSEQHGNQFTSYKPTRPTLTGRHSHKPFHGTELDGQQYTRSVECQPTVTSPNLLSPLTPITSPFANTFQQPVKTRPSIYSTVSADSFADIAAPLAAKKSRKRSRSLIIHYPSESEMDGFDFTGGSRKPSLGKRRDSWHPSRERKDGRYELA